MWKKVIAVLIGVVIGYWFIDDFDPDSLRGQRVLVTGASTGIGEQMAYLYAKYGASVVVTARREQRLQEVVDRCRELGNKSAVFGYVVADMGNLSSTRDVIQEAVQQLGGLDILVLNHILPHPLGQWSGSTQNLTLLQHVIDVNMRSYIHLTSHALPHLWQSKGRIIVMSSLAGKIGIPYVAAYSATKFALYGFFSSLRIELYTAGCPVSITLCTIGLVGTENAIQHLQNFGNKAIFDVIRPVSPADVALAVIKGGALRVHEIFYPYLSVAPLCLIRDWVPSLADFLVRIVNTPAHLR